MTLDEMITVLQAAKEKKKLCKQLRVYEGDRSSNWVPCNLEAETWDFSFWNYKVAPKPRERWIIENTDGSLSAVAFSFKANAQEAAADEGLSVRHFREVL